MRALLETRVGRARLEILVRSLGAKPSNSEARSRMGVFALFQASLVSRSDPGKLPQDLEQHHQDSRRDPHSGSGARKVPGAQRRIGRVDCLAAKDPGTPARFLLRWAFDGRASEHPSRSHQEDPEDREPRAAPRESGARESGRSRGRDLVGSGPRTAGENRQEPVLERNGGRFPEGDPGLIPERTLVYITFIIGSYIHA